ncbi:MAG: HAMP domain-containing protein [Desulfotignum sp.]|nr:HAMP domain-containing protein [Desulfotignum sp.]
MGTASLVLGFVIAYSYHYSYEMILKGSETNARHLTLSAARRIEQEFRSVAKVAQGLADHLSVNLDNNEQTLLKLVKTSVENNPEVYGGGAIFEPGGFFKDRIAYAPYFYKAGNETRFVQLASPFYNYFQKDYYHITRLLNRPTWSDPYFDEGGGDILMVTFSAPVYWSKTRGNPEDFRGIATSDISLEWLTSLVEKIQVVQNGFGFIISDTGIFVTHPVREDIMRESIFSVAEEKNSLALREAGRKMVLNHSGFVDIGTALTPQESFLAFARIPSTGWSLGVVLPREELLADLVRLHQRTLLLALTGVCLLFVASYLLARSMARPLLRMSGAARKIATGDLAVDLSDIRSSDEVGQLAVSFEEMVEGLRQKEFIRDTFGRYLTKEVVQQLLESEDGLKLGGEQRELSLMMSDLRGFTSLTSFMAPEEILTFLNRYLGKMVEILMNHRGVIDEIIGDGILAFFGAPEPMKDHTVRAVACALNMQAAMDEINTMNEQDGYAHLEMGIAVHTGQVVVGNIGSEKRSKYGVVGSDVNFTGRIEGYTVGGQVLISDTAYQLIKEYVDVRQTLTVQMKGIPGMVTLYDIRGMKGPYNIVLKDRDESPKLLKKEIVIEVHRLHKKVMGKTKIFARITHKSQTSVIVLFDRKIETWEDIRIKLADDDYPSRGGEAFGKVIHTRQLENAWEATVRVTSLSPQLYQLFKDTGSD